MCVSSQAVSLSSSKTPAFKEVTLVLFSHRVPSTANWSAPTTHGACSSRSWLSHLPMILPNGNSLCFSEEKLLSEASYLPLSITCTQIPSCQFVKCDVTSWKMSSPSTELLNIRGRMESRYLCEKL